MNKKIKADLEMREITFESLTRDDYNQLMKIIKNNLGLCTNHRGNIEYVKKR